MNREVVAAYVMGAVAFGLSLLTYLDYVYLLGFPDGSISELARAERQLAYVFIGISLLAGIGWLGLGRLAAKRKVGWALLVTGGLYALVVVGVMLTDYYFQQHLMGSGGG